MEKFRNKYVIKSARLENYDYSQNGMYFVTICTKDREEFFGEIVNGKMILNEVGKIAQKCWQEIPKHFPFVKLDRFVVMPNHVHGIVEINWNIVGESTETQDIPRVEMQNIRKVETQNFASLQADGQYKNKFCPQSRNLASIIRGFKVGVKKYMTINEIYFAWQPRFYDHIIRNDESLEKIREYIIENPKMWTRDRNNVENVFM